MRSLAAEIDAAIAARSLSERTAVWFGNPPDDETPGEGFWVGPVPAAFSVTDGRTGATAARTFAPGLLSVGKVALRADLTVQTVELVLNMLDEDVEDLVRGSGLRGAAVQVFRIHLDPDTRQQVAAGIARFVGSVDEAPIATPSEGGEGKATLACVSTARELTRVSGDVRSHESQLARHAGDGFYADTAVVGEWDLAWGQKRGRVADQVPQRRPMWEPRR